MNTRDISGNPPGPSAAVRFVAGRYWRAMTLMTGSAFLGGLIEAVFLILVTRTAFAVTDGAERVGVVAGWYIGIDEAIAIGFALVALRLSTSAFAAWQSARVATYAVAGLRRRLARSFLDASWNVQQGQQAGSLQELVGGFSGQAGGIIGGVNGLLVAAANFVAMLGVAVAVDPVGALAMLVSVTVFGTLLRPLRSAVRRRARANNAANLQLGITVNEISQLGMELHVFQVQGSAMSRLNERIDLARRRKRRLDFASSMTSAIYSALAFVALLGAIAAVSLSASASLTSLGAVMLVMLRSLSYGQAIQTSYLALSSSAPAVDQIAERLEYFHEGKRRDGGQPLGQVGRIVADRVSFAYRPDVAVLRDISFVIEPNEVVGIVGPSGGGKSTLVQLLLALRDPQTGRILADGRPISDFSKAEWARKVTFVPQAAHLIDGTVADNIRFLRVDVSDADVERAARLAHVHDEIVAVPEGYERHIGGEGGHLSGGQQQRICIARALVEQPDVIILDEPTSALDVKSEHLIRTTLENLKERMTVIIIAHRLSTLEICDRIMVIQDGELVGFDTPNRLRCTSDFYREAVELSGLQ